MSSDIEKVDAFRAAPREFLSGFSQPWGAPRGGAWKYILAFLAGTALIGSLTWLHILENKKSALAYWRDQQSMIADDRARLISTWLSQRRADAAVLSSYPSVQQLLLPYKKEERSSQVSRALVREHLSIVVNRFAALNDYTSIYLFGPDGQVMAGSGGSKSVTPGLIEMTRKVLQGDTFWVGLLGETPGSSFVYFLAPVFVEARLKVDASPSPLCVGVFALEIDPDRSLFPLVRGESEPTRSGETLLLRLEGKDVIYLSPLRKPPSANIFLRRPLETLAAKGAPGGRLSGGERLDYRGVPVLTAVRGIPLTDWVLERKIDRQEALEGWFKTARLEVAVAVCVTLIFLYLLAGYGRRMMAHALKDRVTRQQAILDIQALAQEMVDNIPLSLLILSPDLTVLSANRSFLDSFRLRPQEVVGRPLSEVIQADGPPRRIKDVLGSGSGPRDVLVNLVAPEGKGTRPVRLTLTQISHGQAPGRLLLAVEDLTESERLRAAGEASERRLRELVQSLDAIVWEADAATHQFTFVSQRAEQVLGYPVAQWLTQPDFWERHLHPRDRKQAVSARKRAIAEGRDHSLEYRIRTAEGREVWLRDITHVVLDGGGRALQLRGVAIDSTKVKMADEVLRASEEKYRSLFRQNLAGVLYASLDGTILDCNDALVRILGYDSREEILGLKLPGVLPDPEKQGWMGVALGEGKGVANFEESVRRKDGSVVYLLINARLMLGRGAQPAVVQATLIDLTERKAAEAERTLLITAIEQSPEGIVIADVQGTIQYVNPAFTRASGYSREEALGKNTRILKSGKHDQAFYKKLWDTIVRGEIWQDEVMNRRKDGSFYTEQMTITPVRDQQGKITHFIAIKKEVTEQKHLEQQLRQAQKMEAVGRLAGGVAHDFNNILTIISGYSELLLEHPSTIEPLGGYVNEISNAARRAASLTRQLLAFSRQQVLAPRVVDLNSIVSNVEKMLRRLIGEDIDLVTVLAENLWHVKADPGQLEHVLMNLAVNARDAMPQGGMLTIETANMEADENYAQVQFPLPPGSYVVLAVTDTGIGMDAETQARIFEPFFTTKEKGKGTGLGLAMAYGTVKQSGGYIWVNSEVGKGTTFKVFLPRSGDEMDSPGPGRGKTEVQRGMGTILLVEDEDAVRSLVRNVLEKKGYQVLEASHGEGALKLLEKYAGPLDLLVTDVVMPQMSGRELADRLAGSRPALKVLFISGYTDDTVLRHGVLESGAAFLQKPFLPEALVSKVREVLGGSPRPA